MLSAVVSVPVSSEAEVVYTDDRGDVLLVELVCISTSGRHARSAQCNQTHTVANSLVPNSTTRTPATDITNGRAHNNSTTCCTTKSPPTDKNLPHPNILTCRDVGLWHCNVANLL